MKFPLRRFAIVMLALSFTVPAAAQVKSRTGSLGVDVAGMDRTVRPQDDFFRFVNGTWDRQTEIPADATRWGSFNVLRENASTALQEIIEATAAKQHAPGSNEQKIGDYYRSFMDSTRIESLGIKPLAGELTWIATLKRTSELAEAFARLGRIGVRSPVAATVTQDPKNSDVNSVMVSQSGLGMPDRDYYLRTDEKSVRIRGAYTKYIAQLFTLAGQPEPQGAAERILALETKLAEKQWDRVRNRDRNATYNKMTVAELTKRAPFEWQQGLAVLAGQDVNEVIVRQPDYMEAVVAIVKETPIKTWQEYLTFGLLSFYADYLPAAFVDAKFEFDGRTVAGQPEQRVRWKRGVTATEAALGEAIGKLYVEKHFTPEAKARMDQLVKNLLAAFKVGIEGLEWMSPATRAEAQAKLASFVVKIGYPERWRDYSDLQVSSDDAVGNFRNARKFQSAEIRARLGKPVERWRMNMTPQTVNASYNSSNNEITFPAGILQPPFFDPTADDAVNYGAIGAVIGHEISHGFDDQGRKSDGKGNLRDWWTEADAAAFEARATRLGAQYEAHEPIDGIKINGRLTMGENIGDLSGLAVAYSAYRISLGGEEAPVIDGFTGDQRFFLGFAQIWRSKSRPEYLRNQLLTNPHSPEKYRALVPLTNFDPFYKAFDLKPGDQMYRAPEDRVKIW
jgi:predicted metalloendopeptidase